MNLDLNFFLLMFFVFLGGMIDSIAGGGGLITIPAYINWGIDLNYLLGTNKLSSSTGTLVATLRYLNELKFEKKYLLKVLFSSAFFSSSGVLFISIFPGHIIKIIIITVLPIISLYLLLSKKIMIKKFINLSKNQITKKTLIISSAVSFYDGMLGPGTGTFLAIFYSNFLGYDILMATTLAKFTNLISNISALISFIILKRVNFEIGIIMGITSAIGNYIGSIFAIKKGSLIINPLLVLVSNAIIIKIFIDFIK
jgi:uncharacterized membrane protein YfcA